MNKRVMISMLVLFAMLALPVPGLTAELSGSSRTFMPVWEFADDSDHVGLYEYLDLQLSGIGSRDISFHFGGWGRVDLADDTFGDSTNEEFQYGYVNYRHEKANAVFRAGRLFVSEGVAAFENLDGLYASGDLAGGFSLALYGGVPIETDEDDRDDDLLYGGRLSFAKGPFMAGLSYLLEENNDSETRKELGVDILLRPLVTVTVSGNSFYNDIQDEWMEHDYRAALGPWKNMTVTGEVTYVDYGAFFQSPDNTAFSPFVIDPDESLLSIGGSVRYQPTDGLSFELGYTSYDYDVAAQADSFGARLGWNGGPWGAGLTFRRMAGDTDDLQYFEYRGYLTARHGKFDATIDLLDVVYDQEINGTDDAYALALALGYSHTDSLRIAADLEYGSNPFFDDEVKGMVKILWQFSAGTASKGGAAE
jgi:hypothetical protein